ncbi:hypothetical protein D3273_25820 [Lichenibacterium minor]|uniref:Uncharacterized protein n=1 Tax=Lichenibacterium minor TaxID=2316528 RepID=A0A4Q2U2L9_9HYPH|nr:hypothetical protein [Lichenibacterium minor]RYC29097.1 hypothetical protein D3273_25820 [Lichenibacterium minor]
MSYVATGIAFVVVCIALFVWRMISDAPSVVRGEPVPSELRGQAGLAGDFSGLAAGADGGAGGGAVGEDGGGAGVS